MKNLFAVLGVATMLALSLTMFMIFTIAYMSPAKAARVQINNYGEADAEMIFLSALLPLNIISTFVVAKKFTERENSAESNEATAKEEISFS